MEAIVYPSGAKSARARHESDFFRNVLEDFYGMRRSLGGRQGDAWQPPTDVYETEDDIVIKMSLPGIQTRELAVDINGEVVTVCGVRKGPDPGAVTNYHQMEIRNGYFERKIILRIPFDPQQARGEYKDGFAYIYIPKAKQPARRVVRIKVSL